MQFHPSVVHVDNEAFQYCRSLKEVVLNKGLKSIGGQAFEKCTLESIQLPSTVTDIGRYAFNRCTSLKKVVLNNGLISMGRGVFRRCTSLKSITIPSTLVNCGPSTFRSCRNLREVVINEGLQKIGDNTFYKCTALKSITLPSSLTEIDRRAFRGCVSLYEVVALSKDLPLKFGQDVFQGCTSLIRLSFKKPTRLETIIKSGHWLARDIDRKINAIPLVLVFIPSFYFRNDIVVSMADRMGNRFDWELVEQSLNQINSVIRYYEIKEETTLLELALWKAIMNRKNGVKTRSTCGLYRIEVPGPVKENILQFLR